MLQASAAVGTLSPDRGTLCQMPALTRQLPGGCSWWGGLSVVWQIEADRRAGFRSPPASGTAPLPTLILPRATCGPSRAVCPYLLYLFGPSTSASAGPGEVASLGCCLQNTNSPELECGGRSRETRGEEAGVQALVGVRGISDWLPGVPEPSS